MADPIKIKETEISTYGASFSATVGLDNSETYQLRVVNDSIGNTYIWVDHRVGRQWTKLVELLNGEHRNVGRFNV